MSVQKPHRWFSHDVARTFSFRVSRIQGNSLNLYIYFILLEEAMLSFYIGARILTIRPLKMFHNVFAQSFQGFLWIVGFG